jgi:dolichyl-phosphate beta-glucosyltransferase
MRAASPGGVTTRPECAGHETRAGGPRAQWSVVLPAYNEAHRLPRYLTEILSFFARRSERFEVLVVDDGSTDGTAEVALGAAAGQEGFRVLHCSRNLGKGAAVRLGMLAAEGRYRLFADADGATPIHEIARFEEAFREGADIVIGSRTLDDPTVSVIASRHRVAAGRVFNGLTARCGVGVHDSQCGFKAFTAAATEELFPLLRTSGFAFDVELLLLARALAYRVREVPVNWVDQPGSKVRLLRDGPLMVGQILLARARVARTRADRVGGTSTSSRVEL